MPQYHCTCGKELFWGDDSIYDDNSPSGMICKECSEKENPPVTEYKAIRVTETVPEKMIPNGIYLVTWKDDDRDSFAAIGTNGDGSKWLAPVNWVFPANLADHVDKIECMELIK